MKKLLLVLFLGICVSAFGQGARFGDANPTQTVENIAGYSGLVVKVIPGATINFCAWPANAVPCTNKVQTYTDYTLQATCPTSTQVVLAPTTNCVGTADSNGNWGVWVAPGLYQYTFTYQGNNYGPFFAVPTGNGVSSLNCPNAANLSPGTAAVGAMTSQTAFNCDPNFLTDLAGNWTAQSGKTLGPVNGMLGVIGGSASPGTLAKYKLGANEMRWLGRTLVTPYYLCPPSTTGTVGQVLGLQTQTTDGNGDIVNCLQWQNSAATNGVQAQVNGSNLANCTGGPPCSSPLLNFVAGSGMTITNTSGGNIQFVVGSNNTQITDPSAPTLTVGGTPGASTVTYVVQLCEDGPACQSHTHTATATATTANATLSSSPITISAFADSIYGWRCVNVYRTVGGPSQGLIIQCGGKSVIDTGLAASAGTATNTNNTSLIPTMNPSSGGCNYPAGSPQGIDGLPCAPNAIDNEMTNTFGAPGDANDGWWSWLNQGSCTSSFTGGELAIDCPSNGSVVNLRCLKHPLGSIGTSYTITSVMYSVTSTTNAVNSGGVIALYESGSGKLTLVGINMGNGGNADYYANYNSVSSVGGVNQGGQNGQSTNPRYYRLQRSGSTLNYFESADGVFYKQLFTQALTTPFTTAPDNYAVCSVPFNGPIADTWDYVRVTVP